MSGWKVGGLVVAAWVLAACTTGSDGDASDPPSAATPPAPATTRPTATPSDGLPPAELVSRLRSAVRDDDAEAVSGLAAAGADLEARDGRGRTPLLLAAAGDHVEAARALASAGADPDALDDRHDTPWLVTGVTGSVAMAKVLLPLGPDLTIRNRFGGLSIIPASERGHAAYVAYVLENTDIDVDHVNDLGWTALLEAVILGEGTERWQDVVLSLLEHGADRTIADADGVTALRHARSRGFTTIAGLLAAR